MLLEDILGGKAAELLTNFPKLSKEQRQLILEEYGHEMEEIHKKIDTVHDKMMSRIREMLNSQEESEEKTKHLVYSDSKFNVKLFETSKNKPFILEGSPTDLAHSVGELLISDDHEKQLQGAELHKRIVTRGFED